MSDFDSLVRFIEDNLHQAPIENTVGTWRKWEYMGVEVDVESAYTETPTLGVKVDGVPIPLDSEQRQYLVRKIDEVVTANIERIMAERHRAAVEACKRFEVNHVG